MMWTTSEQLSTAGEGTPRPVFSGLVLSLRCEATTTAAVKSELTLANRIQREN